MILIAGFPYIRENYLATFRHYSDSDQIFFLLPKVWKIKDGKVVFRPPKQNNIYTTRAFFYHSSYPVIGGLLKGWMPAFPLVLWRLRKQIKLVYACSEPNLLTTSYFNCWSKIFGFKCINFTWENVPYQEKSRGIKRLIKKIIIKVNLALSDGLVCGNAKGKVIFQKLTKKPITVIPMSGVDPEVFRRGNKEKKFAGCDWSSKIVFTFAGSISYRKGIHEIIKAFKEVVAQNPLVHLVIAGSGEYEKEVETMIKNSSIAGRTTRFPWIDHTKLPQLFEASDVFLYPSISYGGWEEQFGYSMAEASLMELPVIATDSGSIPNLVLDGQTGILVPENDSAALSKAMLKLAADPDLRKKMGFAGRRYIFYNFSHSVIAKKFADFFKEIYLSRN